MNEIEWLLSDDPVEMLRIVDGTHMPGDTTTRSPIGTSERKLRLYACACCLTNGSPIEVVNDYEQNGPPDRDSRDPHTDQQWARSWTRSNERGPDRPPTMPQRAAIMRDIIGNPYQTNFRVLWNSLHELAPGASPREVSWISPEALGIAEFAYDSQEQIGTNYGMLSSDSLKILSDALEEAGCPMEVKCPDCSGRGRIDGKIRDGWTTSLSQKPCKLCHKTGRVPHPLLKHLRSPGPHFRGCWTLDLILGKK